MLFEKLSQNGTPYFKAMEYVVIPADAANDVFRETNKERDLRLEKVNGEITKKFYIQRKVLEVFFDKSIFT